MASRKFTARLASPKCFSWDPRHEQMRTKNVRQTECVYGIQNRRSSRLLGLPDEILWYIVELLAERKHESVLSSLALVNRGCRHLARPHQFADIHISRSDTSLQFLRHLKQETKSASNEDVEFSIGACVRSLTIDVHRDISDDPGNEIQDEWEEHWQVLIDDLAEVVETALPNLDRVFWKDTADLHVQPRLLPSVLQHIAHASGNGRMHELSFLDYKFLFNDMEDVPPILSATGPPLELQSLAFGYDQDSSMYNDVDGCTVYFAETLLRRCATTLESLVWNGQFRGDWSAEDAPHRVLFRDGPIAFSKLRKFWSALSYVEDMDPGVLEYFLSAPLLESFSPSSHLASIMLANGLPDRYPLPQLHTFAVSGVSSEIYGGEQTEHIDNVLTVASRYAPQIEELFVYLHGDAATYETTDSPSVETLVSHYSSDNFCNLRLLCFSWVQDPGLKILHAIGSHLHTLEELSFGFKPNDDTAELNPRSEHNTWPTGYPSHQDIIAAISPLKNLVRLGVFGDEHVAHWSGSRWAWHRFFKEHVWFHQGRGWETTLGHTKTGDRTEDWTTPWVTGRATRPRYAVRQIATKYAEALPKLEEFMCGRVLVSITELK